MHSSLSYTFWFSTTPKDSTLTKRTWHVDTKKKKTDYEVIIIGSGVGGLSCGALLAKKGHKVLVLEQDEKIGGFCGSFEKDGFTFNIGVCDVSGIWKRGATTFLLKQLGLKEEDLFVKNSRQFVFNNVEYSCTTKKETVDQLCKQFPKEKKQIMRFFADVNRLYDEMYGHEAITYGFPFTQELITDVLGTYALVSFPLSRPTVYKWHNTSYKQRLDTYFNDNQLKKFLCGLLCYTATPPETTPALRGLGTCIGYIMFGGYYPKGGSQRFANALKDIVEKNGGSILCNHNVEEIVVKNNLVQGVRVGKREYRAPIVVSNANALTTYKKFLKPQIISKDAMKELQTIPLSTSAIVVHVALDCDLSHYHSIITDINNDCHIVVNSAADPSIAPNGKGSTTIYLLGERTSSIPQRETKEYDTYKKKQTQRALKMAETLVPELSKHVKFTIVETPHTFQRYTNMPDGALYAFDNGMNIKRPYFKTPIKGLYLASASTLYGAGIETVIMNGMACAHDICGWKI